MLRYSIMYPATSTMTSEPQMLPDGTKQVVQHQQLQTYLQGSPPHPVDGLRNTSDQCPICLEPCPYEGSHERVFLVFCGHVYGWSCITRWIQHRKAKAKCPTCNKKCMLKDMRKMYASPSEDPVNAQRIKKLEAENVSLRVSEAALIEIEKLNGYVYDAQQKEIKELKAMHFRETASSIPCMSEIPRTAYVVEPVVQHQQPQRYLQRSPPHPLRGLGDTSDQCPICLQPCPYEGNHERAFLVSCGHVYGLSCITRWIRHKKANAKCPTCNKNCKLKDIRKIYASPNEEARRIKELEAENVSLRVSEAALIDIGKLNGYVYYAHRELIKVLKAMSFWETTTSIPCM